MFSEFLRLRARHKNHGLPGRPASSASQDEAPDVGLDLTSVKLTSKSWSFPLDFGDLRIKRDGQSNAHRDAKFDKSSITFEIVLPIIARSSLSAHTRKELNKKARKKPKGKKKNLEDLKKEVRSM